MRFPGIRNLSIFKLALICIIKAVFINLGKNMHICDLLDRRAVNLTAAPINKESAINDLVDSLAGTGCLSDTERFRAAVLIANVKDPQALVKA